MDELHAISPITLGVKLTHQYSVEI